MIPLNSCEISFEKKNNLEIEINFKDHFFSIFNNKIFCTKFNIMKKFVNYQNMYLRVVGFG